MLAFTWIDNVEITSLSYPRLMPYKVDSLKVVYDFLIYKR
jgi:hypothetical protein